MSPRRPDWPRGFFGPGATFAFDSRREFAFAAKRAGPAVRVAVQHPDGQPAALEKFRWPGPRHETQTLTQGKFVTAFF